MGKLIQKGTQALGLTADPTTGQGAMQQSSALQERAVRELEKIGIPKIEAQRIVLEKPELVLSTLEERIGKTEMEDIAVDPRLEQAEMAALTDLQQAGKEGFTAEDRARIEALRTQIGSDEKARQASILQQMAQRGALDSGAQLAAQLGSSQAAAQRASQEAIQLAAQQAAARRGALARAGQMAGQMGSRQFGQQAQQAQAADAIKQFNAAVAARDTAARQQQAQQAANIANQQEMYNKGLIQQQFQNQMAKATGISGALGNQAQGAMNQAQMQAQAAQQAAAGTRGLLIGGAQAVATGMSKKPTAAADGAIKRNYTYGGTPQMLAGMDENDTEGIIQTPEEAQQLNKQYSQKVNNKNSSNLKNILESFSNGYEQGSALIEPAEVGNINPINLQAPQQSNQSLNSLQSIRQKILGQAMANGGMKDHQGMNYESGGEGVVIKSLEDSYAGDELPDRINDGEMVLNLDQQDTFNSLLKELGERRRADEKVNNGEAVINEPQQDKLMAVARKEAQPEDLAENGGNIVEDIKVSERPQIGQEEAMPTDVNQIEDLLKALKMSEEGYEFADGGIGDLLADIKTPYSDMMSREETPEEQALDIDTILASVQPEQNMSVGEPAELPNMSIGEPAQIPTVEQANKQVQSANAPKTPEATKEKDAEKVDEELKSAQNKDMWLTLLGNIDKALAHYDAANPNAKLTPVQRDMIKANFEDKLLKARQMAAQKDDRDALRKLKEDELKFKKDKLKADSSKDSLKERRLDLQEKLYDLKVGREGRLGEVFKHKVKEKDELSDKQVETITSIDEGLSMANDVRTLINKVEDDLGPYASRAEQMKKYIPLSEKDPEFVKMQQLVGTQLAEYVKRISGAAVSEEEAQRLKKNIPEMTDKPNEFKTKLNTFMDLLNKNRNIKLENFKKQGKNPSEFIEEKQSREQPIEGSTWEDENFMYRMKDGKIQRKKK